MLIRTGGLPVPFPFEPYPSQRKYVEAVVMALNQRYCALLESPTGTGKTLSLLLPALTYQAFAARFLCICLEAQSEARRGAYDYSQLVSRALATEPGLREWVGNTLELRVLLTSPVTLDSLFFGQKESGGLSLQPVQVAPRLLYLSRTHTQLQQAIKQINKAIKSIRKESALLGYPAVILGSRSQYCLSNDARVYAEANQMSLPLVCKQLCDEGRCRYYPGPSVDIPGTCELYREWCGKQRSIGDLEDFLGFCNEQTLCPYYFSRALSARTPFILAPYNYVTDPTTRMGDLAGFIRNSTMLVDEAHNFSSACKAAFSVTITLEDLFVAIDDIRFLRALVQKEPLTALELDSVLEPSPKLLQHSSPIERVVLADLEVIGDLCQTMFRYFATSLKGLQITTKNEAVEGPALIAIGPLRDLLNKVFSRLKTTGNEFSSMQTASDAETARFFLGSSVADTRQRAKLVADQLVLYFSRHHQKQSVYRHRASRIPKVVDFAIRVAYISRTSLATRSIQIIVYQTTAPRKPDRQPCTIAELVNSMGKLAQPSVQWNNAFATSPITTDETMRETANRLCIELVCFSPSTTMKSLLYDEGIRLAILTSGTLSPLDIVEAEYGVPFKIQLSCPHIVGPEQYIIRTVVSVDRQPLCGKFNMRKDPTYLKNLGYAIRTCVCNVVGGVLVFFSSYVFMNETVAAWERLGLLEELRRSHKLFIEQSNTEQACVDFEQYRDECARGSTPIFFVVCRGKLSEGVDMSDALCRCVIVVSIPFPNSADPGTQAQTSWLEEHSKIGSRKWYELQACQSVNQAIGRVLRHRDDYGCIFLLDSRYEKSDVSKGILEWMRRDIASTRLKGWKYSAEPLAEAIETFFKTRSKSDQKGDGRNGGTMQLLYQYDAQPTKRLAQSYDPETLDGVLARIREKVSPYDYSNIKKLIDELLVGPEPDEVVGICEELAELFVTSSLSAEADVLLSFFSSAIQSDFKAQLAFFRSKR
ncbi:TFIIH basal transcription factor complex helicase subunit [Giardia muris]|uniref:TFIIH basal transcription factor complex helicase subunit n=1 Tax=Giardia muris TaxID=5742 RepID=A0A4Z1SQC7_GIAMU|nr:TFIIH basal transcription factor complex helicase subunit [Giardia muris]|eukprot:TNJ27880.1 TFIIH basal transcription factor complex helicase subunit [Giardia muris]